ncbi:MULTISPECIES: helix-turn-helix transcriptional regulator [Streptomyces]|uniref:DNA-binding protein n=1 Tax=Streptomyces dengpaensis TaxID=2049881 RepID=A0ABN5IBX9_9ACTN|nr:MULTISPECIES: helix-turn-helix domain-containing protein [Streptomyces]AVH59730.1 DNA-binding protein [Streptomyces dengpaensis]PIB09374.1 DNA-binding protein [Streptomyces sp. HG99]
MPERLALPIDPDALLTPEQVSTLTQFEVQTLANMRWRKTGPTYLKFGNGRSAPVRYRRRDVLAWLDSQVIAA